MGQCPDGSWASGLPDGRTLIPLLETLPVLIINQFRDLFSYPLPSPAPLLLDSRNPTRPTSTRLSVSVCRSPSPTCYFASIFL